MSSIIEVNGLWKAYTRGTERQTYLTLGERLSSTFKSKTRKEKFWALQDIDFKVEQGDSLAIIGRNGAGKSTLLKILSRITPPTKGDILLGGRLASLLEVGTGFHGELTGRENIYLNGSILGLSKAEIKQHYDAIVDFSGVEKFLETPLKHYSSGMQLRLAFSVAAHLDPEILVIDEVLAVGDSSFQQKCIDKMTEVSRSGRTILFVSHNVQAVRNLCSTGILLENGKIAKKGTVEEVLDTYLHQATVKEQSELLDLKGATRVSSPLDLRFKSISCKGGWSKSPGESLTFDLKLSQNSDKTYSDLLLGIMLRNRDDLPMVHLSNHFIGQPVDTHEKGTTYRFTINDPSLRNGRYRLVLFLKASEEIQDWISDDIYLDIADGNRYAFSNSEMIQGLTQPDFTFEKTKESNDD